MAVATQNLLISTIPPKLVLRIPKPKCPFATFAILPPQKLINSSHFRLVRVNSVDPHDSSKMPTHSIAETLILCVFSLTLLSFRCISNTLLPDFTYRWSQLIISSEEAEATFRNYPPHLWKVVVAYEDRRFFAHFGVDPVGIARAVLSLSNRGGGSTITQQLAKNMLLKNERTIVRKAVEMVLALSLEKKISKFRILSFYLSKIYWGHGLHGIESASIFYFGKHPSLLSLGECALLAGLIPAPELRSPFRDSSRGKVFQARVLKRMVEVGFLDIDTALQVVKQSLHLCFTWPKYTDANFLAMYPPKEAGKSVKHDEGTLPTVNVDEVWDWERESKTWEVIEHFEIWATYHRAREKKEKSLISSISFGS